MLRGQHRVSSRDGRRARALCATEALPYCPVCARSAKRGGLRASGNTLGWEQAQQGAIASTAPSRASRGAIRLRPSRDEIFSNPGRCTATLRPAALWLLPRRGGLQCRRAAGGAGCVRRGAVSTTPWPVAWAGRGTQDDRPTRCCRLGDVAGQAGRPSRRPWGLRSLEGREKRGGAGYGTF